MVYLAAVGKLLCYTAMPVFCLTFFLPVATSMFTQIFMTFTQFGKHYHFFN